jgi:hypothetical protein
MGCPPCGRPSPPSLKTSSSEWGAENTTKWFRSGL